MRKYLLCTVAVLLAVAWANPATAVLTLDGCVVHMNAQNIDGAGTVGTTGGVSEDPWEDIADVVDWSGVNPAGYEGYLQNFDGTAGSGWEASTAVPGAGMLQFASGGWNSGTENVVFLANNAPDTPLPAEITTNTWTVEGWVSATSSQFTLLSAGRTYPMTSDGSGYHTGTRYSWHDAVEYPSMHARVFTADGLFEVFGDTNLLNDTGLHHLVYQYDGSAVNLYLDGNLDGTGAVTGDMDWENTSIYNTHMVIGGKYITSYWDEVLDGDVYAVRVYNRALSLAEVQGNYAAGADATGGVGPVRNRGDVTGEGFVGADDLVQILTNWGDTGDVPWEDGDIAPYGDGSNPGDDFIGADDYVEVLTYWGTDYTGSEPVPEPAALVLLLIGSLALVTRKG